MLLLQFLVHESQRIFTLSAHHGRTSSSDPACGNMQMYRMIADKLCMTLRSYCGIII